MRWTLTVWMLFGGTQAVACIQVQLASISAGVGQIKSAGLVEGRTWKVVDNVLEFMGDKVNLPGTINVTANCLENGRLWIVHDNRIVQSVMLLSPQKANSRHPIVLRDGFRALAIVATHDKIRVLGKFSVVDIDLRIGSQVETIFDRSIDIKGKTIVDNPMTMSTFETTGLILVTRFGSLIELPKFPSKLGSAVYGVDSWYDCTNFEQIEVPVSCATNADLVVVALSSQRSRLGVYSRLTRRQIGELELEKGFEPVSVALNDGELIVGTYSPKTNLYQILGFKIMEVSK